MELYFLGTGAGVPAKNRNVSSIALQLLNERGATWLFDCGEATQQQILHTSIRPRRIEKIFITHLHGDHIFGLPGLLSSRSFQGGETPLTIYGPVGLESFLKTALSVSNTHLKYPIHIVEVEEGVVFEDKQFCISVLPLEHGIPSFGYRIVEKDLPGELFVDKLKEIGVKPGPIFQRLKNGESIVQEDGTILDGRDFVGEAKRGRIVTILGDTKFCENSIVLAKNADVLVHEATFGSEDEKLAYEYGHSTTVQAATVALRANVKTLILTHISSRYQGDTWKELQKQARTVFRHTLIANDFSLFEVNR